MGLCVKHWSSVVLYYEWLSVWIQEYKVWGGYFYNRWRKLYVPYFTFFTILLLTLKILHIPGVDFGEFIKLIYLCQGFLVTEAPGVGHLWFITAIFACYWITPLIQKISSWSDGKYNGILLLIVGFLSFGILIKGIGGYAWSYAWFFNYVVGYFLAKANKRIRLGYLFSSCIFLTFVLLRITWPDIIDNTNINVAFHAYLAHIIFILFILASRLISQEDIVYPFKIIEKYSLYIYLVHYPFTRCPWTVVGLTNSVLLDIITLIAAITLSTCFIYIISRYVGMFVDKVIDN